MFASDIESNQTESLIEATAEVNDGILYVILKAPKHLTISDSYQLFSKREGMGIDCVIDEIQVFEEKGWFSDSLSRKESLQVIHIQNNTVNMAVEPEMHIARNVFNNSASVRFALFPSE